MTTDMNDLQRRMDGAVKAFQAELSGLRTGRASANLLEPVMVDAYGSKMPLNQLASVAAPEPRLLTVQVWDREMAKAVEKAIREAGLGLNPAGEGQLIRVPLPELSEDRRKELIKVAHKYAENTKVAIRNIRRDGMDGLKADEKAHKITEDEHRKKGEQVQKMTDEHTKKVDEMLAAKEKDIMSV